jgi:hypothetical protein
VILASGGAKRKWGQDQKAEEETTRTLAMRGIASEFLSPLLQLWSLYLRRLPKMISSGVWGFIGIAFGYLLARLWIWFTSA